MLLAVKNVVDFSFFQIGEKLIQFCFVDKQISYFTS